MVPGLSTGNALNAVAVGVGIIGSNVVANVVASRVANPNLVDGITALAGLLIVGLGSGPVRAAGIGIAGMGAARLISRNLLAQAV